MDESRVIKSTEKVVLVSLNGDTIIVDSSEKMNR